MPRLPFTWQCLMLMATTAMGQFDPGAWPAYEHPRSGFVQMQNCYSGLYERAAVVSANPLTTMGACPTNERSQRAALVSMKTRTSNIIEYNGWIAPTNTPESVVYLSNTNTIQAPEKPVRCDVSAAQLLAFLKLPANFFTYTPYRGLDGVGPFTNDVSVGHAHGWTNAQTAAGGTNFPSGRSQWYTTDYGWDGERAIITALSKRLANSAGAYWWNDPGLYGRGYQNTKVDAYNEAVADIHQVDHAGYEWESYADDTYTPVNAKVSMPIINYGINVTTNFKPIAYAIFPTYYIDYRYDTNHPPDSTDYIMGHDGAALGYTRQGAWPTNLLQYGYYYAWQKFGFQCQVATTNTGNQIFVYIGSTNTIPPIPAAGNYGYGVGLRHHNAWTDYDYAMFYLDYTGDDGFKFKSE